MTIVPFEPEHLAQMKLQARQQCTLSRITAEWLSALARGHAVSVAIDGEIIASGGLVVQSPQSGFVWAAFSQSAGRHFLSLHRVARRLVALAPPLERIEAVTEIDFPQGRRWLELLGFRCVGRIANDGANGEDHFLYVRTPAGLLN